MIFNILCFGKTKCQIYCFRTQLKLENSIQNIFKICNTRYNAQKSLKALIKINNKARYKI